MRARLFAAAIIVLLSAPSRAFCDPPDAPQGQLAAPPYPANQPWKIVTDVSDARHWHKEWIPADQQVESFKDILSTQAFLNIPDPDPVHFVQRMLALIPVRCDNVSVNGPRAATENGLPVAYGQFFCGQVKGQNLGTHSFMKVIRSADTVFVINRDFRTPPSLYGNVVPFPKGHLADAQALIKAEFAAAKYLDAVHLCTDAAPTGDEHCPLTP